MRRRDIGVTRRMAALLLACLALTTAAGLSGQARAQEAQQPQRTVRVGVYASPPFVMEAGGAYSGMAIELWETIAQPIGLQ